MELLSTIIESEAYKYLIQYIDVRMMIVIPCLVFIGFNLKKTPKVQDWMIPYILNGFGIIAGVAIVGTVVGGIVQGILVTAMSVMAHQLYKQYKEKNKNQTE